MTHQAPGGDLTAAAGNPNLCMSCHQSGGVASSLAFAASEQALPWPGLPSGTNATGTSHRWDANAAGHIAFLGGAATASTGLIMPSGVYTGAYAKTYTISISTAGAAGTARFNWTATTPGGGSGASILTATNVLLDQGVLVSFVNGTGTSFQLNDRWNLYVRSDLRNPTNSLLLAHMANGVVYCSVCHAQHSQAMTPFDPAAPAYTGAGTGNGRHFMRVNNDHDQMCKDCHNARNVTNSLAGSHPVSIITPTNLTHKRPVLLPLEKTTSTIGCLTCHAIHDSPVNDGKLLRLTNSVSVCIDCHTQSDTTSPGAHFAATNSATLWPGGKNGSLMPARTMATDRGSCLNCHAIHGWPDAVNPTNSYPKLLADFEEKQCFTCHGTNDPAVKLVQADFSKARHHPVLDSEQKVGRSVECGDCHNPHMAGSGGLVYSNTATATRNRITNPLKGVSGVAVTYTGLTNFVAPPAANYIALAAATNEYQICFKCHSGYAWGTATPPAGLSPNGTATTPAQTDLAQEFSPANRSGHPIFTGLDNYTNSTAVGSPAKRGLQAAALKAPWNVNIGTQTMMCTDCHNTDAASPAAQGPHGSAAQFILRGPNANNWPNIANSSWTTSWCANCHNNSSTTYHGGNHGGNRCYECHIVIPHGGKVSRLLGANGGGLPARYAYNNTVSTMRLTGITKTTATGYSSGNCGGCNQHSSGTEKW